MFVDSSVVVAILSDEEDAIYWSERLERGLGKITSPLVVLEAAMRLSTKLAIEPGVAEAAIEAFLDEADVEVVPIESRDAKLAIAAFSNYGKGRGHPAQLNL